MPAEMARSSDLQCTLCLLAGVLASIHIISHHIVQGKAEFDLGTAG